MKSGQNDLSERANRSEYPAQADRRGRSALYNYTDMRESTVQAKEGFAGRLSALRIARNVSAREMSLSLGQGAGYINNIENGGNLPSMGMFFEICEFLEVSPDAFFAYTAQSRPGGTRLLALLEALPKEKRDVLLALAELLKD